MSIVAKYMARAAHVLPIAVVLVCAPMSMTAHAQSLKVGYVDAVRILDQAPQAEEALKQLEKEFGPRDEELRKIRNQIQELEDNLDQNSLVMTDSQRRADEKQLRDLKREFQRSNQEFREDYNIRRNEELAKIQRKVTEVIVEIAKSGDYDLIVQESVYVSEKLDITQQVLKKLAEE